MYIHVFPFKKTIQPITYLDTLTYSNIFFML